MTLQLTLGPTKIYKDLDFGFTLHPNTNDVSKRTDFNAIKQSIVALINTRFGERPFQPNVGSMVPDLLFNLMDPMTSIIIQESIKNCVQNYEPRALLNDIAVDVDPDNTSVDITITYTPVGRNVSTTFTLSLTRLR